jgi:hypothetical protein
MVKFKMDDRAKGAAIGIPVGFAVLLFLIIFIGKNDFIIDIMNAIIKSEYFHLVLLVISCLLIILFIFFTSLKTKLNKMGLQQSLPVIVTFGLVCLMLSLNADDILTKSLLGFSFLVTFVLALLFGFKYLDLSAATPAIIIFGLITLFLPLRISKIQGWWYHVIIAIACMFTIVFGFLLGYNRVSMKVGIPMTIIFGLIFLFIPFFYKEYEKWWIYVLATLGFILTFIFSFLLGYEKVKNDIGIPIIVIFGIIFLYSTLMIMSGSNITAENVINYVKENDFAENADYFKNDFMANIPVFIFIILLSVIIHYAIKDPEALTQNAYKYVLLIFIPFILFMLYSVYKKTPENTGIALLILCLIAVVGVFIWGSTNKTTLYIFSFFSKYLLIPLIALIGFAIFYKIIMQYINSLSGYSRFIVELIFFIPCLLIDLVEFIKQQLKITPSTVYILFILEILLILIYIYLPKIISKSIITKSTVLLQNPTYLSKEKLIATSKIAVSDNKDSVDQITPVLKYRTNYSISLWTIINTHSVSNISSVQKNTIFKYGHIDSNNNYHYKPYISYIIDKTGDNYIFQFSNTDESTYKISLPTQKWHNFVFNYNNSRVDLFVNGKLEKTYEFSDDLPVYSSSDEFTVGNENGLDGAICNVQYFTVPLTNADIANLYSLNVLKNPPV